MSNLCVLSSTTRCELQASSIRFSPPPRKQKEVKGSQIGKEDVKYSLFIETIVKYKVVKSQASDYERIQ